MIVLIPYRSLLKILFIFSLFLFAPLFESSQTITVFQDTKSSYVMSIHSPMVKISADKGTTQILLNVSYVNPATKEQQQLTPDAAFFFGSRVFEIKTDKPGTYIFEFLVDEIVQITIDPVDIYSASLGIFFFISTINIVVLTRDYVIYMEN